MLPLPLTLFVIVLAAGFIAFLGQRLSLVTAIIMERRRLTALAAARPLLALIPLWPWLVAALTLLAIDQPARIAPLVLAGMSVECALLLLGNALTRQARSAVTGLDDLGRLRTLTAALMALAILALVAVLARFSPTVDAGPLAQSTLLGPALVLLIPAVLALMRMDRAAAADGDDALGLPRSSWYAGPVTRDLALEQDSRALILRGTFSALALAVWVALLVFLTTALVDSRAPMAEPLLPLLLAFVLAVPQIRATLRLTRERDFEAVLIRPLATLLLLAVLLAGAGLILPFVAGLWALDPTLIPIPVSAMAAALAVALALVALAVLDGGWHFGPLGAGESWAAGGGLVVLLILGLAAGT